MQLGEADSTPTINPASGNLIVREQNARFAGLFRTDRSTDLIVRGKRDDDDADSAPRPPKPAA